MPQLQHYFGTDASSVQLSLSASMFGLAVGQIFFGPLSDKYGRRPVVIASLWLFIASTLACLWSASIEMFVTMRVLQGIGGSGGIVLSRSIATDRYWGEKLAKMMAVIGAIHGVAPVAAPIVGGMMTDSLGWQGIFTYWSYDIPFGSYSVAFGGHWQYNPSYIHTVRSLFPLLLAV